MCKALLEGLPTGALTLIYENTTQFRNITTLALLSSYKNQEELNTIVTMKEFNNLVLEVVIFWIGKYIFGTNMIGRNSVYCLKHLMRDYKVNPKLWYPQMGNNNDSVEKVYSIHAKQSLG